MDNPFKSFFHLKKPSTNCAVCAQTVMAGFEIPVTRSTGLMTEQDYVCCKACEDEYKLQAMRSAGL